MKKIFWVLLAVFVVFLLYLGGMILYATTTDYEPKAVEIPQLLQRCVISDYFCVNSQISQHPPFSMCPLATVVDHVNHQTVAFHIAS